MAKKSILKKWWFWAIIIVIGIGIGSIGGNGADDSDIATPPKTEITENEKPKEETPVVKEETPVVKEEAPVEKVPTEHKSALKKAKTYSDTMHMSKAGLYEQLVSEFGEKFTPEAAQYAIDNLQADWNKNALEKAKTYQDTMDMSPSAIYDQLTSEYGEKFTAEEAQYAIDNLQ